MTLEPPDPLVLSKGATLRWFVGDEDGLRSSTWSVVGAVHTAEAFFSARAQMGAIKLTLHESMTRLAHTDRWWATHALDPEQDRLIQRWSLTAPFAPGWRRALQLLVPTSSLAPALPEKRVRDGNVSRWPSPGPGFGLQFDVLIGDADASEIVVQGVGEVGRFALGQGASAWVLADFFEVSAEMEEEIAGWRSNARAVEQNPDADAATVRSWVWGTIDADGTPSVIDLGAPD